jgi:Flp pilus assembly protein TadB
MTHTPTTRARLVATGGAVSLVLVASLLLAQASTSQAVTGQIQSVQAASGHHEMVDRARTTTARQLRLHDHMRKLWEAHVTWTRLAIVTFAGGSAGFDATAQRLLRNQEDIGDAFATFYGKRTGHHLASLLHDHITIAVEILQAAKAGDQDGVADASTRWYANAREIADFVSSLDRHVWPRKEMRSMMRTHLDQTLAEAVDELTGHYHAGVREYAAIERHILEMADMFSTGLIHQFPGRFR